ncbi:hypothetical protein H6G36_29220 [Anabaena minutissima FACHB-250]|nr:hypothetical protein [Anabaena minutissima FACHB-250]
MASPLKPPSKTVPPQQGLNNIPGTSFFTTPNTPANPTDCNRYPNSPFCGNPFNNNFVDIDSAIVFDGCNLGIQFTPTIGYIQLPSNQIVYRFNDCKPPPLPPPTRLPREGNKPPVTQISPVGNNPCFGFTTYSLYYEDGGLNGANAYSYDETVASLVSVEKTSFHIMSNGQQATHRIELVTQSKNKRNSEWVKAFRLIESARIQWLEDGGTIEGDYLEDNTIWNKEKEGSIVFYVIAPNIKNFPPYLLEAEINLEESTGYIVNPSVSFFKKDDTTVFSNDTFNYSETEGTAITRNPVGLPKTITSDYEPRIVEVIDTGSDFYGSYYVLNTKKIVVTANERFYRQFDFDNPPPPPPEKDKDKDKMDCCEDTRRLLRLILQRIGPLPASVPTSLVKTNSGTTTIQSLAQYIAYSVIQTNAQFGQFPQEINIQDADLTQEGDQSKQVKLPNLAETLAEIVGMLLVLQSESNANLIATINGMIEAGNAKQLALLASDYAQANAEFLGYKGKQIEHKMPFTFKPGEGQLDKMLKAGEVKVKGFENDDKSDLNDLIMPILEMAAMYRASNFRNVGTSDPYSKISAILRGASLLSDAADVLAKIPATNTESGPGAPPPEPKKDEWDSFVEQIETGFIGQPGITDTLHPYGRPLDQRPRIRDIGQDTSEDT